MQAQARYAHLIEANIFGVLVGNAQGTIFEVNNAFLDMIGYTRDEIIGGGIAWHQLTPPEYEEMERHQSRLLLRTGQNGPWEKEYIRRDGTRFPALVSGVIIDAKNMVGMIFIIDLTKQKRAEEERQQLLVREQEARRRAEEATAQLSAVFDAIADGVTLFDVQGDVILSNATGRAMLGIDGQDNHRSVSIAERVRQLQPSSEQGKPLSEEQWIIQRILAGEKIEGANIVDVDVRTLDGRSIVLGVSGAPVRDARGYTTGGVLVYRDITAQREQEKRTRAILEQQRDSAERNERAQRILNQHMDEFISIASHELRNPITTIRGLLQLAQWRVRSLLRQNTQPLPETSSPNASTLGNLTIVQDLLERAEQQVMVQNRLVGDLLDSTRVQVNNLKLQPASCDIVALVKQTVEDQQRNNPTRTLTLSIAHVESLFVTLDEDRIRQVLTNYLTNALKYSPPHQPVHTTLSVDEHTQHVCIAVSDRGKGLTAEEQERIWERFYRAPSVVAQHNAPSGLGLGLHICRALIDQHGGQVGVTSQQGQGSTFWFTLPLSTIMSS
jgi:PAS domain S-box-containing protein